MQVIIPKVLKFQGMIIDYFYSPEKLQYQIHFVIVWNRCYGKLDKCELLPNV